MPKLSVHLVTWNGAKYVPALFDSLKKQTFQDWKLYIWDNGSTDDMVQKMKQEILHFPVSVECIENKENLGFAGGHNKLFQKTEAEYFLCLNQDMVLQEDCLLKLVSFLDTHQDVAVVSPRLMKWDFGEQKFTDFIDTLGLKVFRSRRVVEKYAGKTWSELQSKMKLSFRAERFRGETALEVFGVSGALPMFRTEAMKTIAFADGTFFDESYHSYKEDVDVAFRLRSAGFAAYTLLDAVAHHDRSAAGPSEMSDASAVKNKKTQSNFVKYHSYKNHLMTLYKNEYAKNLTLDFPFILWYELKKFLYYCLFGREVLKGWRDIWNMRKELREKRRDIKNKRKVASEDIRKWWK